MILLVNVFITDKRFSYFYDRGRHVPPIDRLSVFKYMLASFAEIKFDHVYLYVALDDNYASRRGELDSFIDENFPDAHSFDFRVDRQPKWQEVLEPILALPGDELIWFYCNDDQIFVDYDMTPLNGIIDEMRGMNSLHEYFSCFISSFPATICELESDRRKMGGHEPTFVSRTKDYYVVDWANGAYDSNQIVNKRLLHAWWFKNNYGDAFVPRTDWPTHSVEYPKEFRTIIPLRPIIEHFDGYSHAKIHRNTYPDYAIPPGFFENDIKISFCADRRREGFVHVNPLISNYSTVDTQGTDFHWVLEDIPLFWRKRISETKVEREFDFDVLLKHRNESFMRIGKEGCPNLSRNEIGERLEGVLRKNSKGETPLFDSHQRYARSDYLSIEHRWTKSAPAKLSVIVLEKNPGKANHALTTLKRQSYPESNVELVSIGCLDEIEFRRDWARLQRFDVALNSNQPDLWRYNSYHYHRAMNEGAIASSGELIVFLDSLGLYPESLLSVIVEKFERLAGEGILKIPVQALDSQNETTDERLFYLAMSRNTFMTLRGFDESDLFQGEAWDFSELCTRALMKGIAVRKLEMSEMIWQQDLSDLPIMLTYVPTPPVGPAPVMRSRTVALARGELGRPIEEPDAFVDRVNDALIAGHLDEALEIASCVATESNELASLVIETLTSLRDKGDTEMLSRYLQLNPVARLEVTLGIITYARGRRDIAEQCFTRALALNKASYHARKLLIDCWDARGDKDGAATLAASSVRFYPKDEMFAAYVHEWGAKRRR